MKKMFKRLVLPTKSALLNLGLLLIMFFAYGCDDSNPGADSGPKTQTVTLFKPNQIWNIDCEGKLTDAKVKYTVKIMTYNSGLQPVQYGSTYRVESCDGLVNIDIDTPESGEIFVQVEAETDCIKPNKKFCSPKQCSKQYYKITTPRTTDIRSLSFMVYDFDSEYCCN
jgi:hypothetical protein